MSSEIYELMKRSDEADVVERAHRNPRFVEDVVREMIRQVADRSGGNPLFAEEMVNRILEEGSADAQALPETVHSVLAARLDSLRNDERLLLQHASVAGQTFWEGSIPEVVGESRKLTETLASLKDKDLIVPTAGSRLAGEHEYAFKHVLLRDVAYSTLPKAVRARRHAEGGAFINYRAAHRAERRVRRREPLRGGDEVGNDTPVVHREPLSGAAPAAHDLVGDHEDPVLTAHLGDRLPISRRGNGGATGCPTDRLSYEGRDSLRANSLELRLEGRRAGAKLGGRGLGARTSRRSP